MKTMALGMRLGTLLTLFVMASCSSDGAANKEPRYTIVRSPDPEPETSGLPPDKLAEIQLILQQREHATLKCYQDVLNERQDRGFEGRVAIVIHFEPQGRASSVRVVKSTLNSPEVENCLVEAIKGFEFPELEQDGDMQHEYQFRPAY